MLEDATFWAFVALVLFLGLMVYLKVPGVVTAALDKRADAIRKELDEARRLREEAQALLAEYQRKGREAETEAEEIIDQAKREADALGKEAGRRLDEYVASRTKLAEQKIAQAEAQAITEVRSRSVDVAIAEGARDGARQAAAAKRAAIESNLAAKLDAAEKRIGEIKSKALADVGEIAAETTEALVRALVETDVTGREVADAVSSVMAK